MGFSEVLTLIFVALKLLGAITWSWWLVLLPEIIAVALSTLMIILNITTQLTFRKHTRKFFDKF